MPETLESLSEKIKGCTLCSLSKSRTLAVPGTGNPKAKLFIVGEGPGHEEDLQGKPFVGAAGQLLTKILASIGFTREEVFITNIVKCRPPNNRNPLPNEIQSCFPYLIAQIEAIKPKLICALGTFAAQTLLNTDEKISKLRGKFHDYRGIPLLATFHPAFLLRNPEMKRPVWEDMKKLKAKIDESEPRSEFASIKIEPEQP